jgi:plasmid stabilization system protein ParE
LRVIWSRPALGDLVRLHAFLAESHPPAAAKLVQAITVAVGRLAQQPRLGVRLEGFEPHEVRRIIVGRYELRYALACRKRADPGGICGLSPLPFQGF